MAEHDRMFKVGLSFGASLSGARIGLESGTGSHSFCTRLVIDDWLRPEFYNHCSILLHCAFTLRRVNYREESERAVSREFLSLLITSQGHLEAQRAGRSWERQDFVIETGKARRSRTRTGQG